VTAIAVHQGIVNRREIVLPLSKVATFGDEVAASSSILAMLAWRGEGSPGAHGSGARSRRAPRAGSTIVLALLLIAGLQS
jgi:hypothetical protein